MKSLNDISIVLILILLTMSACTPRLTGPVPAGSVEPDLYFVRGYRSDSDPCKLTGETEFTNQFLDDAADLVTCPNGDESNAGLVETKHAVLVAQTAKYTLYSVPRR